MINHWVTIVVAIGYLLALFAIASYGDRSVAASERKQSKPNIYALSLAIYCTTWTFFGSVGLASTSGLSFLAIYAGPIIAITLGFHLIQRVINLSREERITSVADFLGSRYGKNVKVAAVAAIIAVIGTIPYIALQLKAISSSVDALIVEFNNGFPIGSTAFGNISLIITLTLIAFTILFGTRHTDATESQNGLILAVAAESVIKLIAFLCVGIFVTWFMFDGIEDLFSQALDNSSVQKIIDKGFDAGNFLVLTFLSLTVFLLLPRQFHVAVVENNSDKELKRARWLFPLYLVLINLFVIPIAFAGILKFGVNASADDYVLLLPMLEGQNLLSLLVFIGGLSAGTAMVIVASVALSIMISNDLALPLILRSRAKFGSSDPKNMETTILNIRRSAIFGILMLAYIYFKLADNTAALASIGLVSFAAVAQLAPSFFGGLFWKGANARGAMVGMITGFCVWGYCLLLPTLLSDQSAFVTNGLFGIENLKPDDLFGLGLTPIANGVIWSLFFNTAGFIIGSRSRVSDPRERVQASIFVDYHQTTKQTSGYLTGSSVRVAQLQEMLSRYIGHTRAKRSLDSYWEKQGFTQNSNEKVDSNLLRFSEQVLASAIGASSSRLVHTLLLRQFDDKEQISFALLDEASRAVQYNHDVLQTAIDQLEQGITVFDGDLRLASWNRQFRNLLHLPDTIGQAGITLTEVAREIIDINGLDHYRGQESDLTEKLIVPSKPWQLLLPNGNQILEVSSSKMPQGGIVITWHNITQRVRDAEALKDANETLEGRVVERTKELEKARVLADQANISKTRFLAAAGHDILQPLNAARLYSSTLIERVVDNKNGKLAENISRSLSSVEEILSSILAISRLEAAKPEINLTGFPLRAITEQLELEFQPIAAAEGNELRFVHSSKWVYSDRAMLKRVLQNLISNALKFTRDGRILVGTRNRGTNLSLEVLDTGIGMTEQEQREIFEEFKRLNQMKEQAPGLGLGLSIVERIAKLLDHEIEIESQTGKGTKFSVLVNTAEVDKTVISVSKAKKARRLGTLKGTNILCIDNDQSILDGMSNLLQEWGCDVGIAKDLEEAKAYLANNLPDIILADYHLEETTGIEVYSELLVIAGAHIPGVLITAERGEEVLTIAKDAGLAVMNKPVKPAALRALITQTKKSRLAAE